MFLMNNIYNFFWRLFSLSIAVAAAGFIITKYELLVLPTMYFQLVAFYFVVSALAFFVNIKGTQKESEIAIWYYLSSVMFKFLIAAMSVVLLTKFFPEQKRNIVFTSFALYPLFEAIVIIDIYKRVRQ